MTADEPNKSSTTPSSKELKALRPAKVDELPKVHGWLMDAITDSPFYNDMFKDFERARLNLGFLKRLHEADPAHIMLTISRSEPVGFMISGPEYGTLWLYWSYVLPERRKSGVAVAALRDFVAYWDNGRFHKISTYTKDGNEVADPLMRRFGFDCTCRLQKHIFGEDYLLYERPLNKIEPGYDLGMPAEGIKARTTRALRNLFGLQSKPNRIG